MATRQFSIRTEPHTAQIGEVELKFVPEMMGSAFLDGYEKLRDAQKAIDGNAADADPGAVRKVTETLREFIESMMLPESAEVFAGLELPDRILVEMTEWASELYGGGSSNRPTGPSNGSAPRSQTPGTRGSGVSPSKASTRTRGR